MQNRKLMLLAVNYVNMIHQYIAHFNSNGNKEVLFSPFPRFLVTGNDSVTSR